MSSGIPKLADDAVPVDGGVGGLTGSVSGDINEQRKKKEKKKKVWHN
jgi:hypothetical protein